MICSCGFPTAIFSVLMSLSTIILNQILVAYGNAPVAAIGIVFKANMFITFLQMGLANGVQPLLGYNFGSGDTKRFRSVESYTKKCCLIVGVLATALYFIFRRPIIRMFINDEEVIRYGIKMLIAYMISGPFIGILFTNMNCMQSAGKALPNSALSILSVPVCFFCIYLWILFILCNVTIRSITVSRLHTAIPICNCSGEICSSQSMSITSLSDQTFSCPISSIL